MKLKEAIQLKRWELEPDDIQWRNLHGEKFFDKWDEVHGLTGHQ